jgi:hypothetical protein
MRKATNLLDPYKMRNDLTVSAPIMQDGMPTGGGLGGMKRLQLQQSDRGLRNSTNPSSTDNNTGIMPPKSRPAKVANPGPAGYEKPRPATFNQQLSTLTSPNFPRRRGQG